MKVLNLRCPLNHVFEGWFASDAEFEQQQQGGWLSCPMCGSAEIVKGLSAPRLARKSNTVSAPAQPTAGISREGASGDAAAPVADLQALQQAWLEVSRHIVAHTEDVGSDFAGLARQMHEGETEARAIRGTATADERRSLADDGIEILPLLLPEAAKHSLQ
ncbi:hypothetical protein HNP33_000940 [Comamonas odontotermitis]|uniref:DUF1178 family protein n=1 Tax=Comamonas odontotermitis TaxID=379895 RepID=A0ABR6RCJ9_9BURK|nr:DUF1178 family protein [Comamonas odontotermitis]MBB6576890.1 hypothetical protein [Comamonas odontotermitis]